MRPGVNTYGVRLFSRYSTAISVFCLIKGRHRTETHTVAAEVRISGIRAVHGGIIQNHALASLQDLLQERLREVFGGEARSTEADRDGIALSRGFRFEPWHSSVRHDQKARVPPLRTRGLCA